MDTLPEIKSNSDLISRISGDNYAEDPIDVTIEFRKKLIEASATVVKWPAKLLKQRMKEVEFDGLADEEVVLEQIKHMRKMVILLNGVGISANQLGYDNRIAICWFGAREPQDMCTMINPIIVDHTNKWLEMKEACLSCGQCVGTIPRHDTVEVTWMDPEGFEQRAVFCDWDARIVQHEVDHLNGLTIVDKFRPADKLANRFEMENLQLQSGIMPKRLSRKGMAFKTDSKGKSKYVKTR